MSATSGESVTPATRLTTKRGQDAIPSWSPDGTKIAFQGFPPGNPTFLNQNLDIFTINVDGTGLANLTADNTGTASNPAPGLDRDVMWSPDSRQLAFNSARASAVTGNQNNDVWRMNRDGSNPVRLTVNADTPTPAAFQDYDAPLVWSPDGNEILFASSRTSTSDTTNFFAYRMSAATGDATGALSVARVEQFQRCDWTSRAVSRPPAPMPAPATPAPPAPSAPPAPPSVIK